MRPTYHDEDKSISSPGASRVFLFLMQRRPAETRRDSRLVEFALEHVLRAAVVKTEHFVVDVQTVHDESESAGQTHAALGIKLKVCIEEVVAEWPVSRTAITGDIRGVIGKSHPQ